MTTPAQAVSWFLQACLLGLGVGAWYGFLRPLRRHRTNLADVLFLVGLYGAWLKLNFGICGGDIRLGYCAGLAVGAVMWEKTVGKWIRPVIFGFWRGIGWLYHGILGLFQKIFSKLSVFLKILFASFKKSGTIE